MNKEQTDLHKATIGSNGKVSFSHSNKSGAYELVLKTIRQSVKTNIDGKEWFLQGLVYEDKLIGYAIWQKTLFGKVKNLQRMSLKEFLQK